MKVTKKGKRFFIEGYTYPIKDKLKARGCRWDKDSKSWYTEDVEVARDIRDNPPKETVAMNARVIIAKATYKEREYPVTWIKGEGMKLVFTDGTAVFWAKEGGVIIEEYDPKLTLEEFEG